MRRLALVLLMAAGLVTGCTHASGPAQAGPALSDCAGRPQAEPAVVTLSCADNGLFAEHLRWSGWGKPVATATGTAVVDLCKYEDCASGLYHSYPVVLVASRALACSFGGKAYTRVQYLFVGGSPFPRTLTAVSDQSVSRPCR